MQVHRRHTSSGEYMIYEIPNLGSLGANAFIVSTSKNNAILVDAPAEPQKILSELDSHGLTLKKILLTHGHCDHIGAAKALRQATGVTVYISSQDAPMLTDTRLNLAYYFRLPIESIGEYKTFSDGDVITLDDISLTVIATPGHTKGSVCFECGNTLFTGDTLFSGSIGRTDFPGGSYHEIMSSISHLYEIGENRTVLCGHGERTDLYYERQTNPFLTDLFKE